MAKGQRVILIARRQFLYVIVGVMDWPQSTSLPSFSAVEPENATFSRTEVALQSLIMHETLLAQIEYRLNEACLVIISIADVGLL